MKFDKVEDLVKLYKELSAKANYDKEYTYYEHVYNVTAFEGSLLSESEVVDLLKYGEKFPQKPLKHAQLVQDTYKALLYVMQTAKKRKHLTPEIIQQIGALVMATSGGVLSGDMENYDSSKGEFRKGVVKNASRLFPDYKRLPIMVAQLCEELGKKIKRADGVEERSIITYDLLFDMLNIYPFGEGNMCVAFLVYNYAQILCDLPISFIYKVDSIRFLTICDQARNRGNVHPYHVFCFKQYIKFLEEEIAEMQRI